MFRNIFNGKLLSQEMQESLQRFLVMAEQKLPDHIRDEAQKMVDESFQKEQYQGDTKSSKWEDRTNDDEAAEARTNRRALLVKSGRLIAATEVELRSKDTIAIAVNDPQASVYAPVHNEGLKAGRGSGFKMKKRQFMPIPGEASPRLDAAIDKWMDNEMDKLFK
jgi:phage gpG-like protein